MPKKSIVYLLIIYTLCFYMIFYVLCLFVLQVEYFLLPVIHPFMWSKKRVNYVYLGAPGVCFSLFFWILEHL